LGLLKNSANRKVSLTNLNRQAKFWRNFIITKHDGKAGRLQTNISVFQTYLSVFIWLSSEAKSELLCVRYRTFGLHKGRWNCRL